MANILRVSDILQTFFTKEAVAKTCPVKKVFFRSHYGLIDVCFLFFASASQKSVV